LQASIAIDAATHGLASAGFNLARRMIHATVGLGESFGTKEKLGWLLLLLLLLLLCYFCETWWIRHQSFCGGALNRWMHQHRETWWYPMNDRRMNEIRRCIIAEDLPFEKIMS
jgi:hypothetical protein